jgi:three-Cys-motif partner protein
MKMKFGGSWTEDKLGLVHKYLPAYTTALKNQSFHLYYIDAFAGTGYRTLKESEDSSQLMFPEMFEPGVQEFLDGSARVALEVEPRFDQYIFIEKDKNRFAKLQQLKEDFSDLQDDIELVQAEANTHLQKLCRSNWLGLRQRAVLFLDPYGMEVKWETIEAIANTKAIDLWLLFPLGVAVNRLLRRDGQIDEGTRNKLDQFFGTNDWYDEFYKASEMPSLFDNLPGQQKDANFDSIQRYFIERLESVFTEVAQNPRRLYNSRRNPLYLLCFATGNPRGAPIAVKIAQHILKG